MGVASAIPGVSGGTIAVITGIYKKLINAVNNIFKHFVSSFLTLLPIFLGVVFAIIPCVLIFDKAFEGFVFGLVSLFAGFIIGSFPGILDEIKHTKPKVSFVVVSVISGLIALGLGIMSVTLSGVIDFSSQMSQPDVWFFFLALLFGVLASLALVVPGISGSMLLLVLGFYTPLIESLSALLKFEAINVWATLGVIGCFGAGIIIGFLLISKLMAYLLEKHHDITFYSIIGFIVGSTIALYFNSDIYNYYLVWGGKTIDEVNPFLPWFVELPIAIVLLCGGVVASYILVRYSRKSKLENNEK